MEIHSLHKERDAAAEESRDRPVRGVRRVRRAPVENRASPAPRGRREYRGIPVLRVPAGSRALRVLKAVAESRENPAPEVHGANREKQDYKAHRESAA